MTGAFKRGPAAPAAQEEPDLRRPGPKAAAEVADTAAMVRTALAEPEAAGLDIPAFLRRQSS